MLIFGEIKLWYKTFVLLMMQLCLDRRIISSFDSVKVLVSSLFFTSPSYPRPNKWNENLRSWTRIWPTSELRILELTQTQLEPEFSTPALNWTWVYDIWFDLNWTWKSSGQFGSGSCYPKFLMFLVYKFRLQVRFGSNLKSYYRFSSCSDSTMFLSIHQFVDKHFMYA